MNALLSTAFDGQSTVINVQHAALGEMQLPTMPQVLSSNYSLTGRSSLRILHELPDPRIFTAQALKYI